MPDNIEEIIKKMLTEYEEKQSKLMFDSSCKGFIVRDEFVKNLSIFISQLNKDDGCSWTKSFDGNFNISCVSKTGQRGNGQFKDAKWNFKYCPYCSRKIVVPPKIEERN